MTDGAETPGHNILAAGTQTLQQEEKDAARENTAQTTMIAHLLQITLQQWSVPVQLQSACSPIVASTRNRLPRYPHIQPFHLLEYT